MIITSKRKLTSGVAILCAFMILIGIFPINLFTVRNAEAAGLSNDPEKTVKATLYDYYTDGEIAGNPINTSVASGFWDPYTTLNSKISGGNLITVYFDNPNNWPKTRIYAFGSDGKQFTGTYSNNGNPGTLMSACNKTYNGTTYKFCYTFSTGSVSSNISVIFIGADNNGYVYEQYETKPSGMSYRFAFRNNIKVGNINYCKGTKWITDPNDNDISDTPTAYVEDPLLNEGGLNLTYPLYFGAFYLGEGGGAYTQSSKASYNNFYWAPNIVQRNDTSSSLRGLVRNTLNDSGQLVDKENKVLPYFNAGWLESNGVGASYNDVDFTFKRKGNTSYYYFDSEKEEFGYYYDKSTGEVKTGSAYKVYNNLNGSGLGFFPFDNTNHGTAYSDPSLNMGFGMNFAVEFGLPKVSNLNDVKDDEGNDIIFSFRGDDDVWVYVDDHLTLDLGGAHGRSGGAINFTKQKVRLYNSIDLTYLENNNQRDIIKSNTAIDKLSYESNVGKDYFHESTLGAEKDAGYIQWDIKDSERNTYVNYVEFTFEQLGLSNTIGNTTGTGGYIKGYDGGDTKHHIQFYYMERGMFESNLYVSFNMSVIDPPKSSLTIEEETDFSTVYAGLVSRTMEAANKDVFGYSVTNTGLTNDYVGTTSGGNGLLYPYTGATVTRRVTEKFGDTNTIATTVLSNGEQLILQYKPPTNYTSSVTGVYLNVYLTNSSGSELYFTNSGTDNGSSSWNNLTGKYVEMAKDTNDGFWKVDLSTYITDYSGKKTFAEFYEENKATYPTINIKFFGVRLEGWTPCYYNSYAITVQFGNKYIFDESSYSDFTWPSPGWTTERLGTSDVELTYIVSASDGWGLKDSDDGYGPSGGVSVHIFDAGNAIGAFTDDNPNNNTPSPSSINILPLKHNGNFIYGIALGRSVTATNPSLNNMTFSEWIKQAANPKIMFRYGYEGWYPSAQFEIESGYGYTFTNNKLTSTESIGTAETGTAGNFVSETNVQKNVANVNFERSDDYASSKVVGRTGDDGVASLMFDQSAYFLKQFEDKSILTVQQNSAFSVLENDIDGVAILTNPTASTRNVATYYDTTWTLTDAKNTQLGASTNSGASSTVISGNNGTTNNFKFYNADSDTDAMTPVALTAKYVNTPKVGSLRISKALYSSGDANYDTYTLKIKLTDILGQEGVNATTGDSINYTITHTDGNSASGEAVFDANSIARIPIVKGDIILIEKIPVGTKYDITEDEISDFVLRGQITGTIDNEGTTEEDATNERNLGTLKLVKTLNAEDSSEITTADKAQEYRFKVTLSATEFTYNGTVVEATTPPKYFLDLIKERTTGTPESDWEVSEDGKEITAVFKVSANTSVTIGGIPYGTSYAVEELAIDSNTGDHMYSFDSEKSTNLTGRIGLQDNDTVVSDATATVVNEQVLKASLIIKKFDSKDKNNEETATGLSGAKFQLYTSETGNVKVGTEQTTGENGTATFEDLEPNTDYWIEEVEPPAGYLKVSGRTKVTTGAAGTGITQYIYNSQIVMPEAGGEGKEPFNFVLFGAIAIALAGGILLLNKKYAFLHISKSSKEVQ